jgi:hypothetical protein
MLVVVIDSLFKDFAGHSPNNLSGHGVARPEKRRGEIVLI